MKTPTRPGSSRRPSRRWHIPPPLIHGAESLEGGAILKEWNGELSVVLWQAFRDVMLWTNSDSRHRSELFAQSEGQPDETFQGLRGVADEPVESAIETLRGLSREPTHVREDRIARASRRISEWAVEKGRMQTALAFAQNAALAARNDPAAAFWVATIAVRLNDSARAEVWFRRAIGLARRSRNWRMYSRAFSGLGNLYMRRGNFPSARTLHIRALRGARRGGMRREQATALHDLFGVAVETGNAAEAERLAAQALKAYGTRSGRVHVLAHDLAYFWMERGQFRRAFSVFSAVLPLVDKPIERLFVLADICRAAGGMGATETVRDAAEEVSALIATADLQQGAARALLEVARGFVSLDDPERAEAAARRAIFFAERFREGKIRFAAEALIDSLAQPAPEAQTVPGDAPATEDSSDRLAEDFVRTLETIAGTTR